MPGTPIIVIEVLSPSTATCDQGAGLEGYDALPGIELVGFIDTVNELVRSVRRMAPSGWLDRMFSASDLEPTPLGLVIPHAETLARD